MNGESRTRNANYLTTISEYVIVYKHHRTSIVSGRRSDYWHSKHVTLRIHSTFGIGVFDTLFPLLLCTLDYVKKYFFFVDFDVAFEAFGISTPSRDRAQDLEG